MRITSVGLAYKTGVIFLILFSLHPRRNAIRITLRLPVAASL